MLSNMTDFCTSILTHVVTLLAMEPFVYLFGFLLLAVVIKIFKSIIS